MTGATRPLRRPARAGRAAGRRGALARLAADRPALACLVPVAILAVLGWQLRWVNEDGFIYLRIVDNLLAGHGPVFNPGERVEAYTGPAWLALLTVGAMLLPFASLEYVAVVLGLALAATGLLAGAHGALLAVRALERPHEPLLLPLGALVVAALPPFWDFATAGLETGMALAWIGVTFWCLARRLGPARRLGRDDTAPPDRPLAWPLAVLIGLGPLVRPDLGVFAAGFLLLLVAVVARPAGWRATLGLLAAAAALPVAHQLFRMGYFATLVPNTALAKEAGLAFWSRGWAYAQNAVLPYALWLPVVVLLALGAREAWDARGARPRRALAVLAAPAACGILHAVYVVRLGGDYMHARMLLPSVFGVLLSVGVVAVPRRWWAAAPAGAVVVWAVVCASALRASSDRGDLVNRPYLDQRRLQLGAPGHPHPVTLADHAPLPYSQPRLGYELRRLADEDRRVLVTHFVDRVDGGGRERPTPYSAAVPDPMARPRRSLPQRVVAFTGSIGRMGYAAGPDVRFVDRFGLADPIGARLRLALPRLARAGHEKQLPLSWVYARYAERLPAGLGRPALQRIADARATLACPPLRRVLTAVTAPLTARRFARNIGVAWRERSLRIPGDPGAARRELCR